mgnify:CR=1 FL=1
MDTDELKKEAARSESGEAFLPCLRGPCYRLGVGARRPGVFLEVVVDLFPREEVDLNHLEQCLPGLRELVEHGYELSYEGNGSLNGEKKVDEAALEKEMDAVAAVLKKIEEV